MSGTRHLSSSRFLSFTLGPVPSLVSRSRHVPARLPILLLRDFTRVLLYRLRTSYLSKEKCLWTRTLYTRPLIRPRPRNPPFMRALLRTALIRLAFQSRARASRENSHRAVQISLYSIRSICIFFFSLFTRRMCRSLRVLRHSARLRSGYLIALFFSPLDFRFYFNTLTVERDFHSDRVYKRN